MQNALVTGAASGIGAAAVELLRARGYRVLAVDLTPGAGIVTSDVADPAAWARLAALVRDEMGELHLAHLNAGVPSRQPNIAELTDHQFERTMAVNLGGVVYGVRALLPVMAASSDIVVTASIAGVRPAPLDPIYTASKHALIGLVRSIAPQLAERGVRINALCPSYVDTPMARGNPDLVTTLARARATWLSASDVAAAMLDIAEGAAARESSGEAWVCVPGRLYRYDFTPIAEPFESIGADPTASDQAST